MGSASTMRMPLARAVVTLRTVSPPRRGAMESGIRWADEPDQTSISLGTEERAGSSSMAMTVAETGPMEVATLISLVSGWSRGKVLAVAQRRQNSPLATVLRMSPSTAIQPGAEMASMAMLAQVGLATRRQTRG